jgi:peptidoglycan/xylan/chitin deacetylase (PgdA/CDA1 family)
MDNNLKGKIIVVFRNDDPSACSDVEHEQRITDMFDRHILHQTLGVVPFHCEGDVKDPKRQRRVRLDENPRMVEFLREYVARSGSEIALHGYTHQANRISCPSRREHFEFEGLGLDQQEEMIARGTEILVENFGTKPCTFIPPWNRLDRNTVLACLRQGYKIVSSGPFTPVVDGIVSLGMNCELDTFPSLFERARTTGRHFLLVINYHSRFITGEKELALLERTLSLCACSPNTEVLTVAETVRLYPELVRKSNEAAMNIVPQWQVPDTERSRVVVYRRALRGLGIRNKIEQTYSAAYSLYWQGRYEETNNLSPLIDRLCRRLQMSGRCSTFASGAAIGVLIWAISSRFNFPDKICWHVGALVIMALLGTALKWRLTNKDAKRETLIATLLGILGAMGGIGSGELVSFLY